MWVLNKLSDLFLNSIAYFILEPRFKSGKWHIRQSHIEHLGLLVARFQMVCEEAGHFFRYEINLCSSCSASCCYGAHSRLSVYDYIGYLVSGVKNPPRWGYLLYPIKSYSRNRIATGVCPYFIPGKGCALEYCFRPAICCIYTCGKMEKAFTYKQRQFIRGLRQEVDRVHWRFALALLFGGMQKA